MATVSTKEIKNRIRSMESTKQITRAMEMVAASKLRHAQTKASDARPYFEILLDTIEDIVCSGQGAQSPYLTQRPIKRTAYVVIAGDRGLAGGYNSNLLKLFRQQAEGREVTVLPMGKKALEYFRSHKIPLHTEAYAQAADISLSDCFTAAKDLCSAFLAGNYDEIRLVYTNFVSVLSQEPASLPMLPLGQTAEAPSGGRMDTVYEPSAEEVFAAIVPEYLGGILYGAVCQSLCAEQAARRAAMDSATRNAGEMIDHLTLKYNRARQAAITQEITEIVAGAQA